MDIRTVIFLFSVFVFFTCHSWAQDQTNADCEAEWDVNVTWDTSKMFVVQWSGVERKSDVRVRVSADNSWCILQNIWFQASFSEKLLNIKKSCSNSEHEFNATIFCNNTEVNEKIISGVWTPPDAPTNISLGNATDENLEIWWNAPSGNVTEYKVSLETGATKQEYASKDTSINISGLSPYTEYIIRVQAKNHLWSELSDALKTRTKEGIPVAPTDLRSESITNTSINLRWGAPHPNRGEICNYTLQWKEANTKDPEAQNDTTNETSLEVKDLKPYTNYSFKVRAATSVGEGPWTESVYIKTKEGVPFPPPKPQVVNVSDSTVIIKWSEPLPSRGRVLDYAVETINKNTSDEKQYTTKNMNFLIKELTAYTDYSIRVRGRTAAGNGSWSEELLIRTKSGVPSTPLNLKAKDCTNTSVLIQWDEPKPFKGPILSYTVKWTNLTGKSLDHRVEDSTEFNITDLQPFHNYTIQVRATTDAGDGEWSQKLNVRTKTGVPMEPHNVRDKHIKNTSLEIQWDEPTPKRGPIDNYTVMWTKSNTKESKTRIAEPQSNTGFVIDDLQPFTNYIIRVRATTEAGDGPWSSEHQTQTGIGVPSTPLNLKAKDCTNTSVLIQWDEPKPFKGPILSYTVKWTNLTGKSLDHRVEDSTEFSITDLQPFHNYTIQVRATTDAGDGEWSQKLNVRTKTGVPMEPLNVRDKHIKNTSLEIQWDEPTPKRGPIDNYTVMWTKSNTKESKTRIAEPQSNTGFVIDDLQPFTNYIIRVRATTEAGDGPWSSEHQTQTGIGVPSTPLNLKAKDCTNTSVLIQWDEPKPFKGPILSYTVKWTNLTGKSLDHRVEDSTEFSITDLQPFHNYTIQVRATTDAGDGEWSQKLNVRTKTGVPMEPLNVRDKHIKNTSLEIQWDEPTPNRGPIDNYTVMWTKSNTKESKTRIAEPQSNTGFVIDDLQPFTNYIIRVRATTEAGDGPWSSEHQTQTGIGVPSTPLNLKAKDCTNTSVLIQWDEPKPFKGPILSYTVKWTNLTGKSLDHRVEDSTEFNITDLQPFHNYTIQVRATTDAGDGEWSQKLNVRTKTGVPMEPLNVRDKHIKNTSLEIQWDEPTPNRGPIDNYTVMWTKSNTKESKTRIAEPQSNTGFVIDDLQPFTNYIIRVRATTEAGDGPWSSEHQTQTGIGVPSTPLNLKAKDCTNTSVLIQWDEPKPFKGPILSYTVKWTNLTGKSLDHRVEDSTEFNITDLQPFHNYTIQVRATTDAGDGEWSQKLNVRTKTGVPMEPLNVRDKHIKNTSLEIQWDEPTPNRGPIDNYTVMWTKSNTKESKTRIAEPQSNTGFVIDDLQPFTNYIIRVRATTEAGDGPWSSEHQTQTGIGVPWPPQNVRSKEKTNCTIHLVWEEPQPTTGPILSYTLKWTNVNSKISNTTDTNGNITSYIIKELEPFTDYNVQILARTEAGEGKWSNKVVIRTEIGIPTAPRDVKLSVVTNTTIGLEWNIPSPSNGPIELYIVQWTNLKSNNSAEITTKDLFYKIDNLRPYTEYSIQICARTSAGEGPWSEQLITETKIGIASPPRNVSVLETTAFDIKLSWDIPEYPNSPVSDLKYLVSWNAAGKETIRSEVEKPPFHAVNLTAYTEYTFFIFAQTEVGLSLSSDPLTVRTAIAEPSVPQNLSVVNVTSTTIQIEWSIPEYPNGPELIYDLQWRKEEDDHVRNGNIKTEDTHYELKELEPYTSYSVQVRASTSAGYGPFTESLIISTAIAIPESAEIEAFTRTSRTILVKWNKTGPYPGPVSYSLEVWQMPIQCSSKSETFKVRTLEDKEDSGSWNSQSDVIVENLIPYTSYFFRIKLATKEGNKTSESSNVVKTPADVPDVPQNVKARCDHQPTEAEVSWSPPKYPNGLIVKYRIEYGLENSYKMNAYLAVTDPCKEQKIVLQNLRPERNYTITVRARAQGVDSDGHLATFKSCILPAGIPPLGNTSKILVKESGPHELMIEWSRDAFSDYMGAFVRYAVLVGLTDALGNATSGKTPKDLPNWSKFIAGESNCYQATPPEWNPFDKSQNDSLECKPNTDGSILKCTIGLENNCPNNETYCNGPLRPATEYEMKLRAFTRGGYAESQPLLARTAPVSSSSYLGALVAGLTLLLIVAFLLMGLMVLQRKGKLEPLRQVIRSRFGHTAPPAPPVPEPPQQIEIYQTRGPLDVHNFSEHVRIMMSDSHLRFSQEFEALKRSSPQFPCATAEMEENRGKNRWMNIYPSEIPINIPSGNVKVKCQEGNLNSIARRRRFTKDDHSRVKLLPLGDEPGSDFVNANYIPGNSSLREYIASQGPLPNTVDDFWRMVWEQSVTVIVMLTQCVERGKNKCEQYWPAPGEMKYYGDLQVRTLSESMLSSYVIRVFHVQLGPRELRVKQMHFTRWPDFGCPESPDDLINFVRAVRDHLPRVRPGPILVHCSAGVGRTGTFIAVDRLSQQLMRSDVIDVYGTVLDLRQYRTNMVQTEDQYIYIHLCVNQLIRERATADEDEYEEAIYSNVGAMKDTGV